MNKAMVAGLGAVLVLVAGCGGGGSEQAPAPTEAAAATVHRIGEDVEGGGVVVNVTSVRTDTTVGDRSAPAGQKYVVLDARVTNNTDAGLDLSCGTAIGHRLVDDQRRRFDVIPGLASVPGNPPCAELVAVGATGQVGWVFEVPADSTPVAFGFYDTASQQPTEPQVIDLTAS
ncbi:hypothetical protein ACFWPA_17605 [Rhodococcus sp. NPDC058505]|uniref:hypothetical protein n=1 Tax=unclassified Rhodococcus (in: high G+C Gram-positive bacteria) TaxID=192944 RepID=UPI003669426C